MRFFTRHTFITQNEVGGGGDGWGKGRGIRAARIIDR